MEGEKKKGFWNVPISSLGAVESVKTPLSHIYKMCVHLCMYGAHQ